MEHKELRPCLFCGGKAVFNTIGSSSSGHRAEIDFKIQCDKCKISFPKCYQVKLDLNHNGEIELLDDQRKQAVEDWNKRV